MTTVDQIAASPMSVADKIRALAAAGLSRAEIARRLGKRYQHVRNVLEGDRLRPVTAPGGASDQGPGVSEPPAAFGGVLRLEVAADGSVRLPAEVLADLGVWPGGVLVCERQADRLVVLAARTAWRRARDLLAPYRASGSASVSDALIHDRRSGAIWDE